MTNHDKRVIWASGQYLCEHLTQEIIDAGRDAVDAHISENLWQPFEYWSADDVYVQIVQTADSLIDFMMKNSR
jgi:hypothetical protein